MKMYVLFLNYGLSLCSANCEGLPSKLIPFWWKQGHNNDQNICPNISYMFWLCAKVGKYCAAWKCT